MPPKGKKEIEDIQNDPTKQAYMICCESDSDSYNIGVAAEVEFPGVTCIRFQNRADAAFWIPDENKCAAVFGWDGKSKSFLDSTEVQDKDAVFEAIQKGRS